MRWPAVILQVGVTGSGLTAASRWYIAFEPRVHGELMVKLRSVSEIGRDSAFATGIGGDRFY